MFCCDLLGINYSLRGVVIYDMGVLTSGVIFIEWKPRGRLVTIVPPLDLRLPETLVLAVV